MAPPKRQNGLFGLGSRFISTSRSQIIFQTRDNDNVHVKKLYDYDFLCTKIRHIQHHAD